MSLKELVDYAKEKLDRNSRVLSEQWDNFEFAVKDQVRKANYQWQHGSKWRWIKHMDGIREEWFDTMPRLNYYWQLPKWGLQAGAMYWAYELGKAACQGG